MISKINMYTDGGARGNPGPAGIGVVFFNPQGILLRSYKKYIGETTNNIAEYSALLFGLEKARELGVKKVYCYLDSELVVKQMNREYRVKDQDLSALYVKAWNIIHTFRDVCFFYIPREKNKKADALVNKAIDDHLKGLKY